MIKAVYALPFFLCTLFLFWYKLNMYTYISSLINPLPSAVRTKCSFLGNKEHETWSGIMERTLGFDWNFGLATCKLNKLLNFLNVCFLNWKSMVITYIIGLVWGLYGMININTWYSVRHKKWWLLWFEAAIFILFKSLLYVTLLCNFSQPNIVLLGNKFWGE